MTDRDNLARLLDPSSVAIVGLSANEEKHGARVLRNLQQFGFQGDIWGVNPRGEDLHGVPTYATLSEVPGSPDAVVLAIPAARIHDAIVEAGELGAGGAVLFGGGFAEAGDEGAALQRRIRDAARAAGVRLVGPNSAGIVNAADSAVMSFLTCLERPSEQLRPGPVALITQSGGTASFIHNLAAGRGSGTALTVSTGNEADVEVGEVLQYAVERPDVRCVALLLETVRTGPSFLAGARRALELGKPIVVCKVGVSDVGRRVMATHTGAMAGEQRRFEAVFDALGITSVTTPEELFDVAEILARVPVPHGDGVGVVTHSGGTAVLMADLLAGADATLPQPEAELQDALAPYLQLGASGNPTDLGGIITEPHRFGEVVRLFLEDDAYAIVVEASTPHPTAHTVDRVREMIDLAQRTDKPLINLWLAGDLGDEGLTLLREAGAAVSTSATGVARAVQGLIRFGAVRRRGVPADPEPDPDVLARLRQQAGRQLNEADSKEVLASLGIPVMGNGLAPTPQEARALAERIGFPVVVKLASGDLAHKSELGAVALDVRDADAVEAACTRMLTAATEQAPRVPIDGFLVEEFAPGVEMIVGLTRDEVFGPLVLVGLGGVYAEALDDVRVGLAPLDLDEAGRLVAGLQGSRILSGFRGAPAADIDALAEILVTLSTVATAYGDVLAEVDVNPLIFADGRWRAADAVVRLRADG